MNLAPSRWDYNVTQLVTQGCDLLASSLHLALGFVTFVPSGRSVRCVGFDPVAHATGNRYFALWAEVREILPGRSLTEDLPAA